MEAKWKFNLSANHCNKCFISEYYVYIYTLCVRVNGKFLKFKNGSAKILLSALIIINRDEVWLAEEIIIL